jgi:hypothetical protein
MPASPYDQALASLVAGGVNIASDTLKAMITTSAYTPDPQAHNFKSDVTNEASGTGYTAGGATLGSKTVTLTVANSWGTSRANSTAYALGDIVRPATGNGFLYQAVVAGTSGGSVPTYPTVVGQTVVDGGVTWVCKGRSVLVFDFADPSWGSSTITGRTVVVYKDTGTASTSPLLGYDSAGSDVVSSSGTWTYQVHANGFLVLFMD